MRKRNTFILALLIWFFACADIFAIEPGFEYPCYVVNSHDPDGNGLYGMNAEGIWSPFVAVDPNIWLVGPPPSLKSGVALPPDHWVELQFRGPIVDGPGYDIEIVERGRESEQILVFLTDGRGEEYLLNIITAWDNDTGSNLSSYLQIDIESLELPFEPRGVRIVGLDKGGMCDGFDLQYISARICTDCSGLPACNSIPVNNARNVAIDSSLSWSPGASAVKHIVYFGDSLEDVGHEADPVSSSYGQDANSFDPGILNLGTTYYWRVDEVNSTSPEIPHEGEIWSFTTKDKIVLDDFEKYQKNGSSLQPQLYPSWRKPSYGITIDTNINEEPVHAGAKSMLLNYKFSEPYIQMAKRLYDEPQNWTGSGINIFELFFHGKADNGTDVEVYLSFYDGENEVKIPLIDDPNDLTIEQWQHVIINLEDIQDVNLGAIEYFGIVFTDLNPSSYTNDSGFLYFDDIRLSSTVCLSDMKSQGDFTGDCVVDYYDLEKLAESWLDKGHNIYHVAQPNEPVLWYKFEGNVNDSGTSGRDGQILGTPIYFPGVYGQAMKFNGRDDAVRVIGGQYIFSEINDGLTITFWQQDSNAVHDRDTICCSDYEYGTKNPTVAVNLGCWKQPGRYFWQCGSQWSFDNQLDGQHKYISEWTNQWNHWAFIKDCLSEQDPNHPGEMKIYLNGALLDSRVDCNEPIGNVNSFTIGNGWYGAYEGTIDDFRIYDYALSQEEIAHVATNGTGIFNQSLMSPLDLKQDNIIDFKDYAILAQNWLESNLWP